MDSGSSESRHTNINNGTGEVTLSRFSNFKLLTLMLIIVITFSSAIWISYIDKQPGEPLIHARSQYFTFLKDHKTHQEATEQFSYKGETFRKQYVYYVQVEECISDYLAEQDALGNATFMDVYILSYRRPCKSLTTPAHFTYLFNDKTTWSVGRNILFFHVKDSGRKYYYHIFIDDDVELFYTESYFQFLAGRHRAEGSKEGVDEWMQKDVYDKAIREIKDGMSPWRYYESKLMELSPAYALVNLIQPSGETIRLYQKYQFDRICPPGMQMPWITPSFFLDTRIIAYHHKVLPILLPYNVMLEHVSWPISAVYTMYRAKALLYKQTITMWSLSSINKAHRPYPRNRFPNDYLEQYFKVEGSTIKDITDIRDRDFVIFWDNGKWRDVFFNDRAICTAPIKFPITDHYNIPEEFQRRP